MFKNIMLNKKNITQTFNRIASVYDDVAVLQREVGQRMFERLKLMRLEPKTILDLGSGTGFFSTLLAQQYSDAEIYLIDVASQMLDVSKINFEKENSLSQFPFHFICTHAENLPLPNNSVDFIFSNLMLPWCDDLDRIVREIQRVLHPEGLLLFSTFGPDTFRELRCGFEKLDGDICVSKFVDMHDVGDCLLRNKLLNPVMDMELFTLVYDDVDDVFNDLEKTGEGFFINGEENHINRFRNIFEKQNEIKNTYEIIYGHAWGSKF